MKKRSSKTTATPVYKKMPLVVGLTGGFGTGKTAVACMFRSLGAKVLDADEIAHRLIRKDTRGYKRIVSSFGKTILGQRGEIDKARLGELVFSKKNLLTELCRIIHPAVIREIQDKLKEIGRSKKRSIVVIDAPLLVEAGLLDDVDILVVVTCDRARQIERLKRKT